MSSSSNVLVVFRSRLRAEADAAALEEAGARMLALAQAMPGFVAYKEFAAADGECLTLAEFADMASLTAWRDHPEHRAMQQRARAEFMCEYHIDVCRAERRYGFPAGE
jgi:heme-degrading monooxygenase HmoA